MFFRFYFAHLVIFIIQSQSTQYNVSEVKWRQVWKYYYHSIHIKILEIFNGNCLSTVNTLPVDDLVVPHNQSVINYVPLSVEKELIDWWKSIKIPRQMRIDPTLCDAVYLKRTPIFNQKGCQLPSYMHPSAPRCQTTYLKWICDHAKIPIDSEIPNHFTLPESDHMNTMFPPLPWIVTARNAMVTMCGQISAECGIVHTTVNCMATGFKSQAFQFRKKCPYTLLENTNWLKPGNDTQIQNNVSCDAKNVPFGNIIYRYDKVFVVAEVDDTYIYHIHLEILPRIVYHLQFLKDHPDIKILIGCDSKKVKQITEQGLRQGVQAIQPMMKFINLSMDRLIVHQHIYANEIYLPMEGGCQDPVYNTWQILSMRKIFLKMLNISYDYIYPSEKDEEEVLDSSSFHLMNEKFVDLQLNRSLSEDVKIKNKSILILLKRSSTSKHTRNRFDSVRQWSDGFTNQIISELIKELNEFFEVWLVSDRNETIMNCHECQIKIFSKAKVLIGVHGAGLSNMVYMPPNSAVVEIGPYGNDGRCLLGGGPFSRLAALMSHNYLIHHPPYDEFKWIKTDLTSEFNITRLIVHIRSFLKSIKFI